MRILLTRSAYKRWKMRALALLLLLENGFNKPNILVFKTVTMDEALKNAVSATIGVVNARLKATNNADYMAALSLAENARYSPITDAYRMAEDGLENAYDEESYYRAALNVADYLDNVVATQAVRLNDELMGIVRGGVAEEDLYLAEQFKELWAVWKEEVTKQIAKMKQIVVLDQTPDDE